MPPPRIPAMPPAGQDARHVALGRRSRNRRIAVSAGDLAVAEALYVSHLTNRIRRNWLAGYAGTWARWADVPSPLASSAASWPRWRGVDVPLRMAVFKVTDVMLAAL